MNFLKNLSFEKDRYAVSKKTGEVVYSFSERDQYFAIFFSMILTPVFLLVFGFVLDRFCFFDYFVRQVKFIFDFYF